MWQKYVYIAVVAAITTTVLTLFTYRDSEKGEVLSYSFSAPTPTPIPTPTPLPTATPTPMPTATPTPTPTLIPTATPTPTPTPEPMPSFTHEQVHGYVEQYSGAYAVDPNMVRKIVQCESGFNEEASNGIYAGLFQFNSSTWASTRRAMGLDPDPNLRYHAEEAVKTGVYKISRDGYGAWKNCAS